MAAPRQAQRFIINERGAVAFDLQWKRDARYVIQLLEQDANGAGLRGADLSDFTSAIMSVRRRPYDSELVASWTLELDEDSIHSELLWDVAATDLSGLTWVPGQARQTLFADLAVTMTSGATAKVWSVADADGNYFFPLRVTQTIRGAP